MAQRARPAIAITPSAAPSHADGILAETCVVLEPDLEGEE
jgi:hypothetical protein